MAAPITWKNVNIDNGSSAAAFGSNAANFGRSAVQGLDIFSQQMGDRITREDELLTNEAITAALRGGPQVADNRRVDAEKLQLAVERDALGNRQEQILADDLLTSAVDRRLNTANAGIKEKDLETYDDRWALEQSTAKSEADYRSSQARIAEAELRLKQKAEADQDRIRKGRAEMNKWLYGGELNAQADKEIQAKFADDPRFQAMAPDAKRAFLEEQRNNYRFSIFNDPQAAREIYQRFGLQPIEAEQFTSFGQDAANARRVSQEAVAEQAAISTAARKTEIENIDRFVGGDRGKLSHDGTQWTYNGGTAADEPVMNTVLQNLGFDPAEEKRDKEFRDILKSKFRTAGAYEAAAKQLTEKWKGDLPNRATIVKEVDDLFEAIRMQAEGRAKTEADPQYSSDWITAGNKYLDAMSSATVTTPEEVSDEEAGKAVQVDPIAARESILSLNNSPSTREEVQESGDKLKLAVTGLQEAKNDIKLPDDASRELKILWNRYNAALDVAGGGLYIPQPAFAAPGIAGQGYIPRPEKPNFSVKQQHAAEAAGILLDLQKQIEREAKAKKDRELKRELDNY